MSVDLFGMMTKAVLDSYNTAENEEDKKKFAGLLRSMLKAMIDGAPEESIIGLAKSFIEKDAEVKV